MITEKVALELIQSLSWMQGYPHGSESGVKALTDALTELAADDKHAKQIIGDVQLKLDRCPMPVHLTEFGLASAPRYERDFKPRRKYADEMAWHGDGMYSIWTLRDLALHQHLADNGKTKYAREYAFQMLAGFQAYQQRHPGKGFASDAEAGVIPWNPDVRCHVCNDSGFEYTEIPDPGCVGQVRKCKCKALFPPKAAA
ncbi:MAG TPA: hypothetical protein VIH43_04360 [Chthoniobacterales bacterium]